MPSVRWSAAIYIAVLLSLAPRTVQAQGVELGASLVNVTFITGDDDATVVGVPVGGFGILNPAVYASFRVGGRFAIEPQVGFMLLNSEGETMHLLNAAVQATCFFSDRSRPGVYVFGGAGFISVSDNDYTPKTFGGGVGYRMPVGDRLVFRLDGRYTRITADFGDDSDLVALTLSIGGLFGK